MAVPIVSACSLHDKHYLQTQSGFCRIISTYGYELMHMYVVYIHTYVQTYTRIYVHA